MRVLLTLLSVLASVGVGNAQNLGTAASFGVLGASAVTNTGLTVVNGDVGVYPGTSVSGFPPGLVVPPGTMHDTDAVAMSGQAAALNAYTVAAGLPSTALTGNLGGKTLVAGVYNYGSSAGLTGTLTLDAQGNPNARWVFQIGSALTTASDSSVSLINGAQSCSVLWVIGSSAVLGTGTQFVGNVIATTSITLVTGAVSHGGLFALNGAVTLDTNTIYIVDTCGTIGSSSSTTSLSTTSSSTTSSSSSDTSTSSTSTSSTSSTSTTSSTSSASTTSSTTGSSSTPTSSITTSTSSPSTLPTTSNTGTHTSVSNTRSTTTRQSSTGTSKSTTRSIQSAHQCSKTLTTPQSTWRTVTTHSTSSVKTYPTQGHSSSTTTKATWATTIKAQHPKSS